MKRYELFDHNHAMGLVFGWMFFTFALVLFTVAMCLLGGLWGLLTLPLGQLWWGWAVWRTLNEELPEP
jgi:hypothetical protein